MVKVDDVDENKFTIIPNPTLGDLEITLSEFLYDAENRIIVSTIDSKILNSFTVNSSNPFINIEEIQNGIYFIYIVNKNGDRISKVIRIVKM